MWFNQSCEISQAVHSEHVPSSASHGNSSHHYHSPGAQAKKREFELPSVPPRKLFRACATRPGPPSYVRSPRDRYRERSVSRARDVIVASKRKDAGLPPARSAKFRVPFMQPPLSRHAGGGRNPRSPPPPADRFRARALASMNTYWLQESIKVSLLTCIPIYMWQGGSIV